MFSLPLTSFAILAGTIVFASFVSGMFGMAGGMIVLGVLLIYFDVTTAMVIFSVVQFAANGWRAVLWWRYVQWPIFFPYIAGAVLAFAVLRAVAYVPDKMTVYLLLGVMPFAAELLPAKARPNIEWRYVPFVTGALTTVVQFMAGVGGPFLDVFFQKSTLDRKTTLATKAVTQTFSHVLRAAYFGSFGMVDHAGNAGLYVACVVMAVAGTSLAPWAIERMTDHGFRQWTRWIVLFLSSIYLVRAGWLYWYG